MPRKAGDDRKGVEKIAEEIVAEELAGDNADAAAELPPAPTDSHRQLAEGCASSLVSMLAVGLMLSASRLRDGLALVEKSPEDLELSEAETAALRSALTDALATLPPSWLLGHSPWIVLAVVVAPLAWTRLSILLAVRRARLADREDGAGDAGRAQGEREVDAGEGAGGGAGA